MAIFGALAPILIPAAIGAVTSAAFGKNPLQGAVMGGITGGLLGPAGGNLFSLGSNTAATAGTSAATSAGTAFGASQAPAALASGVGSGATAGTTSSLLGGDAALNQYNIGMGGVTGAPSGFTGDIASSTIATPKFINPALTTDPSKLAQAQPTAGQTFTDGVADQFRPRFDEPIRVAEQATKTGGYEQPLFTRAYEGLTNYAKQNPLVAAQLGLAAFGGINPPQREIQATGGQITKGTPPQGVGTPLRVRRPR